jgi:hypothetical protein
MIDADMPECLAVGMLHVSEYNQPDHGYCSAAKHLYHGLRSVSMNLLNKETDLL